MLALPPNVQAERSWKFAAECLKNAAEREIAWMWFTQPAMLKALHGPDEPPPIGNPEGKNGHRWGKRKLARDK